MGVMGTYCQICAMPVQHDCFVPMGDGAMIYRGPRDHVIMPAGEPLKPVFGFSQEHNWLLDAVALRLSPDIEPQILEGDVHDGVIGEYETDDQLLMTGVEERAAIHRACWKLLGKKEYDDLAGIVQSKAWQELSIYHGQLFDFVSLENDGKAWMLVDPNSDTKDGKKNRKRIREMAKIKEMASINEVVNINEVAIKLPDCLQNDTDQEKEHEVLYSTIQHLDESGLIHEAQELCAQCIQRFPDMAKFWGIQGQIEAKMNNLDIAIQNFDKALAIDPFNVYHLALRGFAKEDKGDMDGALMDFSKAVEIDPYYRGILYVRGCLLFKMQRFHEAYMDFMIARFRLTENDIDILKDIEESMAQIRLMDDQM